MNNTDIELAVKHGHKIKSLDQLRRGKYRVVFIDGDFDFGTQKEILNIIRNHKLITN